MIVNKNLETMSLDARSILYSYSDSKLAKSIIKFIDIILSLNYPVPFHLRNEMLLLQSMLQNNQTKNLEEYIDQLEIKLNSRGRLKQMEQNSIDGHLSNVGQISEIRTCRNGGWDVDK
jgi:hypothetical protein